MNASALLEYFDPLYQYLKTKNGPMDSSALTSFLENEYEGPASILNNKQITAEWNLKVDVANATKIEAQVSQCYKAISNEIKIVLLNLYISKNFRRS